MRQLQKWSKGLGRYSPIFGLGMLWILIEWVVRVSLLLFSKEVVSWHPFSLLSTFGIGLLFDVIVVVQGLLPFLLFLTLLPRRWLVTSAYRKILWFILWIGSCLILLGGIAEFFFWEEFQTRFNFIAVDYLIYTTEVFKNIRESYPVFPLLGLTALCGALIVYVLDRYFLSWETHISIWKRTVLLCTFLLFPVVTFLGVDGKAKEFGTNSYNNQLAGNGLYELFSAFRNNELDYPLFYRTMPEEVVEKELRNLLSTSQADYLTDAPLDLTRRVTGKEGVKKPNVILITVESLSSDFLGIYGNTKGLTPELDALAAESLWFSNVYATGTRTVRGLEAISLGIPPTPGQSIVRRPDNQNLFSLGGVFNSQGYQSHFLYGGYGYFDNMNDFFEKNGYQITDRTDLAKEEIIMENAWGVADEVIFNRALKEMDQAFSQNTPLFQMILTTSNHRPFTYPDGRIDIPSPGGREGAVKYTDWAIGQFIREAKKKPWFHETIFVIVADHQADSAGKTEVPIQRYHIPLLIYGPKWIQPAKIEKRMSQIDLAPTLLGLLNFSYDSRFLGYDIFKIPQEKERIFISTYQSLAYGKGDKLVVLNPKQRTSFYQIDYQSGKYQLIQEDPKLLQEAIAWYQGASKIYKNRLYRNIF